MQVSCNKNHIFRFDYFLWWYQDEFYEDWSNCWLKKLMKCSWCISIFQICEFLLMIHMIFLEDCAISDELDEENHEISMRYYMWIHIQ